MLALAAMVGMAALPPLRRGVSMEVVTDAVEEVVVLVQQEELVGPVSLLVQTAPPPLPAPAAQVP